MAVGSVYRHGVYYTEVETSLTPMIQVTAPIVAFGTAPIHLAQKPAQVNTPILCYTYSEFVEQFGYSDNFNDYTLCEVAYVAFSLYNIAPVIFVNVFNPEEHFELKSEELSGTANPFILSEDVVLDSLRVTSGNGVLFADNDYVVARNAKNQVVLTVIKDDKVENDTISVGYMLATPDKITASDIIGGISLDTGLSTGLECVEKVYPKYRMIPGTLIAPRFSTNSAVASVMAAKTRGINTTFKCMAAVDLSTKSVKSYLQASEEKTKNSLVDENLIVCYPMVSLDGRIMHLSTHVACRMCLTDAEEGSNIPYISPSNKILRIDSTVLSDGTEYLIGNGEANYLNSQGIVTAANWDKGWVAWGNRTSAYPGNSDPKDSFIACRRQMQYIGNTLVTTFYQRVDSPIRKRLVENFLESIRHWLTSLTALEILNGGRVEFISAENNTVDLIDGIIHFHLYIGLMPPARDVEFSLEFDPQYLNALFS